MAESGEEGLGELDDEGDRAEQREAQDERGDADARALTC